MYRGTQYANALVYNNIYNNKGSDNISNKYNYIVKSSYDKLNQLGQWRSEYRNWLTIYCHLVVVGSIPV